VNSGETPASGRGFALPRTARITASDEIRELFRRGKRRKTRNLDVFVSASPVLHSRLGVVVPKPRRKTSPTGARVRGAAVQRNRLKRRLREIGRFVVLPRLNSEACFVDVLIRARPEAFIASFEQLREELEEVHEWICSSGR
jgi:ribonuclease P protein component